MRKKTRYKSRLTDLIDNLNIIKDKDELKSKKGKWHSFFNTKDPIILELGIGNGGFLQQLITFNEEQEKSFNYIGLEVKEERIFKSYRKNIDSIKNGQLKLIISDAKEINNYFDTNEIQSIYLNFSDPWPKAKHHKKRLTAPSFLKLYKTILKKDGDLFIKTDNKELYTYSLMTLSENEFIVLEQSDDLHKEDFTIKNFVTEFESRWIEEGKNIHYIHAQ